MSLISTLGNNPRLLIADMGPHDVQKIIRKLKPSIFWLLFSSAGYAKIRKVGDRQKAWNWSSTEPRKKHNAREEWKISIKYTPLFSFHVDIVTYSEQMK